MMRKRIFSIIILMTLIITIFSPVAKISYAADMEGEGTALSPYLIKTPTDLYDIKDKVSAHYKLVNDLDFENLQRQPISTFSGVLDGDGHIIRNVRINGAEKVALFGTLSNATVKNLGIENAEIVATGNIAGVLFGIATNSTLENNYVKNSKVTGKGNIGMLGGQVIAGKLFTLCHATGGKVSASGENAGGLVGYLENTNISKCYSNLTIDNTSIYTGGLIGKTDRNINVVECFTAGVIKGSTCVGGIIGHYNIINGLTFLSITDSFTSATLLGNDKIGGIIAETSNTYPNVLITNCYSSSQLSGKTVSGIFTGSTTDTTKNSYFNSSITGINVPNFQARSTEEMLQKNNYVDWDFENIWIMNSGPEYPKLQFANYRNEIFSRLKVIMEPDENLLLSVSSAILDNADMTWTTSDSSTVSVDAEGRITAHKLGQATIYCSNEDEDHFESINILVVQDAAIYRLAIDLKINDERRVTIDSLENASNVTWSSGEPVIAKVSKKGKVRAMSKGLALIKGADKDGNELGHVYIRIR